MILKLIYTLFLGILLSVFVGMGVAAFYPEPKAPEYPINIKEPYVRPLGESGPAPAEETAEQKQARLDYDQQQKEYRTTSERYNRNVSLITLAGAIILLVASLGFAEKLKEVSDGILLGGVFTLIYSIGRGFAAGDTKYQFMLVTVGLLIAIILGYIKFIKPTNTK